MLRNEAPTCGCFLGARARRLGCAASEPIDPEASRAAPRRTGVRGVGARRAPPVSGASGGAGRERRNDARDPPARPDRQARRIGHGRHHDGQAGARLEHHDGGRGRCRLGITGQRDRRAAAARSGRAAAPPGRRKRRRGRDGFGRPRRHQRIGARGGSTGSAGAAAKVEQPERRQRAPRRRQQRGRGGRADVHRNLHEHPGPVLLGQQLPQPGNGGEESASPRVVRVHARSLAASRPATATGSQSSTRP